jgi:hypothetical protein
MGIIQEIQNDLLNNKIKLSEILIKAKIPATKLNLLEFKNWLNKEIQGYDIKDEHPQYRCIKGVCRYKDNFNGWQHLKFMSLQSENDLSYILYSKSVYEIEELLETTPYTEYQTFVSAALIQKYALNRFSDIAIFIQRRSLSNILNGVRGKLMEYIAELDDIGIEGNNSNFTQAEKDKAQTIVNQTINVSGGNFMNQVASENSMQELNDGLDIQQIQTIIQLLQSLQNSIEINENTKKELKNELLTITKELQQPLPKSSIIKEGLKSIRTILEGAAGGALTQTVLSIFHLLGF